MDSMNLNNIERVVQICEPVSWAPGIYNVDANYGGDVRDLDRKNLFDILAQEGLDYSGVDWDIQHGFNDRKVMGEHKARLAKEQGKSYIWIGLSGYRVNLEVLPDVVKELKDETSFEYAQRILECVVTYVENPRNYKD